MRERNWVLACLVAIGVALAPPPAFAEEFEGFSVKNLSVGLEFNLLTKGLDAATNLDGTANLPGYGTFGAQFDNAVDKAKLTEVLARVNYRVNDFFTPYLLLGTVGLSFDDSYDFSVASLLSANMDVPYSDSLSIGLGFGAEGVLMELPAELKLSYGVRMFTFSSSDATAVAPEEVSSQLAQLNPVETMNFSTGATYTEWDFSLGVSREYRVDFDYSVTPQIGLRHSSINLELDTEIAYSPGMLNYLEGTFDRSLGGSATSLTLGVTGSYQEFIDATLLVALGDEIGLTVAVTYGF